MIAPARLLSPKDANTAWPSRYGAKTSDPTLVAAQKAVGRTEYFPAGVQGVVSCCSRVNTSTRTKPYRQSDAQPARSF